MIKTRSAISKWLSSALYDYFATIMNLYHWFIRHKRWLYLIIGVVIAFILVKEALGTGDFRCYLNAAILLRDGTDPYRDWIHLQGDNYCLYFYSPLWALFLIPFTYVPAFIPNILWLLLSVFFFVRSWRLLLLYFKKTSWNDAQRTLVVVLSLIMTLRFIQLDIAMIQMTSFLLWVCLEALHRTHEGQRIAAGVLLGLGINIKILPVVFIPYLLYRGHWKTVMAIIGFIGLYTLLPAIVLGWEYNLDLMASWWKQIDPFKEQHMIETELGPHSLTAWIPTLLMETTGTLELKRNLFNLDQSTASMVLQLVRALLILLVPFFLGWPRFSGSNGNRSELRGLAYLFLLVPLIFPHQQKYAFVFIIPAAMYLSYYLTVNWRLRKERAYRTPYLIALLCVCLSFLFMTLTTDGLIGREWNNITQHYKTVTWGALLLIPALLAARIKEA